MANQKLPYVENIVENGVNMVTVSIGKETVKLTIEQAGKFATIMENAASMPASLAHIDNVFDLWSGDDGGTC